MKKIILMSSLLALAVVGKADICLTLDVNSRSAAMALPLSCPTIINSGIVTPVQTSSGTVYSVESSTVDYYLVNVSSDAAAIQSGKIPVGSIFMSTDNVHADWSRSINIRKVSALQ